MPKAPITIGTIVTFMFHKFLILLQGRGAYPSSHFPSDLFCGPPGQQNRQFYRFSFIIIIIIIIHSLELFTSAIADGFSLKSEWQKIFASLQDSS